MFNYISIRKKSTITTSLKQTILYFRNGPANVKQSHPHFYLFSPHKFHQFQNYVFGLLLLKKFDATGQYRILIKPHQQGQIAEMALNLIDCESRVKSNYFPRNILLCSLSINWPALTGRCCTLSFSTKTEIFQKALISRKNSLFASFDAAQHKNRKQQYHIYTHTHAHAQLKYHNEKRRSNDTLCKTNLH